MANSILGAIFGPSPFIIKNETDEVPTPYWTNLKIISVEFMTSSAVVDQPLAIGVTEQTPDTNFTNLFIPDIQNGKIIQPTKLRIKCMTDDLSTVESLMFHFVDTYETFSMTSKEIIAENMIMVDLILTQSTNSISATEIVMEWEQAGIPIPDSFDPDNPCNEPTYGVRIQQPKDIVGDILDGVTGKLTSAAKTLYTKVQSLI